MNSAIKLKVVYLASTTYTSNKYDCYSLMPTMIFLRILSPSRFLSFRIIKK